MMVPSWKGVPAMTREEAERYIGRLSLVERQRLNELLKSLAQTHPPEQAHPVSIDTDE